jgi:hypothetical protein
MRFLQVLYLVIGVLSVSSENTCTNESVIENGCITFSIGQGTGCAWMCEYCQTNLGTTNYYFTDGVCTYQTRGCTGNPVTGNQYTCCSL